MMNNGMRPVHPGEVLREEYLRPIAMSASALARVLKIPRGRVIAIVDERGRVSADTALRLARYFGGGDSVALGWLQLQAAFDLKIACAVGRSTIMAQVAPRPSGCGASGSKQKR
jgi:addiction module HigA family antidote